MPLQTALGSVPPPVQLYQTALPGCSFSIASTQAVTYRSKNHPNPPPLPPSSLQSTIPAQIRAERQEVPGVKRLTAQSNIQSSETQPDCSITNS
ncbi:hypothetical protein CDEST_14067 [Colletotrichum destructivum]|uniref:Uncharacterized protein n=1 Tax=Colletotrichum destructivum TaxID=34406 RepID=A0AAX4J0H2_9PEZI|nr:hypothetical protein CDEST_14067 [Colletotrichum destructivum]